jgi:GC-rich sequence DNA-binding factor
MASTGPVIFKRSKPKPTGRARQASPDNTSEQSGDTAEEESPSILATKLKNKVKRAKPKSRLSFGGDEEEVSRIMLKRSPFFYPSRKVVGNYLKLGNLI